MPSFFLYPGAEAFGEACAALAVSLGFERVYTRAGCTVAIAPRLSKILGPRALSEPAIGTLVFHPSALPYRRGPDAIRWTIAAGERVSAATWFWADEGIDTGPVCEQEVVVLKPGESPGRAYHTRFVPAGLRALGRALGGIMRGSPRAVPQEGQLVTYQGVFAPRGPRGPASLQNGAPP